MRCPLQWHSWGGATVPTWPALEPDSLTSTDEAQIAATFVSKAEEKDQELHFMGSTHTCTHTHGYTNVHPRICMRLKTHTHTHTNTDTRIHTRTQLCTHARTHVHMHTQPRMHTHMTCLQATHEQFCVLYPAYKRWSPSQGAPPICVCSVFFCFAPYLCVLCFLLFYCKKMLFASLSIYPRVMLSQTNVS